MNKRKGEGMKVSFGVDYSELVVSKGGGIPSLDRVMRAPGMHMSLKDVIVI
jgi:hypothetical protein